MQTLYPLTGLSLKKTGKSEILFSFLPVFHKPYLSIYFIFLLSP